MSSINDLLERDQELARKLQAAGCDLLRPAADFLPGLTPDLEDELQLTTLEKARLRTLKQRVSDDMLGLAPLLRALTEALRWLPCWSQAVVIMDDTTDSVQSATTCVSSEPVSGVDQTNAGSILRRRGPVTRS